MNNRDKLIETWKKWYSSVNGPSRILSDEYLKELADITVKAFPQLENEHPKDMAGNTYYPISSSDGAQLKE